jgi:hypothetical protein
MMDKDSVSWCQIDTSRLRIVATYAGGWGSILAGLGLIAVALVRSFQ